MADHAPSENTPLWSRDSDHTSYPPLTGDAECDVAIVGGGIAGLTAGLLLQREGKQCVVLEMRRVGGATTGFSTGHLDHHIEIGLPALIQKHGVENARQVIDAKRDAIATIERLSSDGDIDCDFRRVPTYYYAATSDDISVIDEDRASAAEIGMGVERVADVPLPFETFGGVRLESQARMSPLAYVSGLAEVFVREGGTIHEGTRVESHEEVKDPAENHGRNVRVGTDRGVVSCDDLVLMGHAPIAGLFSMVSRAYPYQSYVLAVRVRDEIPDALYWDTHEPYRYMRWAKSEDPHLLVIGGADHRTGECDDERTRFDMMEEYVRERYDVEGIEARWSHEFWEPADGLPYIGRVPRTEHTFTGTGFSGEGLTFGTVAAKLCSDLIVGRENALEAVLSPARIKLPASLGRLGPGILNMATRFIGDRLGASDDAKSIDDVPRGEGRLVSHDEHGRIAVYRDDDGGVHAVSPVCRHLGCIVRWNTAERTWDCPCHGGRYDRYGKVMMGPPDRALEGVEV